MSAPADTSPIERARRASSRLWLPGSAQPQHRCRICGKPFFSGEERALVRHTAKCAEEYVQTESSRAKLGALMDPANRPDPELEDYVQGRGKARILSGREPMPNG